MSKMNTMNILCAGFLILSIYVIRYTNKMEEHYEVQEAIIKHYEKNLTEQQALNEFLHNNNRNLIATNQECERRINELEENRCVVLSPIDNTRPIPL